MPILIAPNNNKANPEMRVKSHMPYSKAPAERMGLGLLIIIPFALGARDRSGNHHNDWKTVDWHENDPLEPYQFSLEANQGRKEIHQG